MENLSTRSADSGRSLVSQGEKKLWKPDNPHILRLFLLLALRLPFGMVHSSSQTSHSFHWPPNNFSSWTFSSTRHPPATIPLSFLQFSLPESHTSAKDFFFQFPCTIWLSPTIPFHQQLSHSWSNKPPAIHLASRLQSTCCFSPTFIRPTALLHLPHPCSYSFSHATLFRGCSFMTPSALLEGIVPPLPRRQVSFFCSSPFLLEFCLRCTI